MGVANAGCDWFLNQFFKFGLSKSWEGAGERKRVRMGEMENDEKVVRREEEGELEGGYIGEKSEEEGYNF